MSMERDVFTSVFVSLLTLLMVDWLFQNALFEMMFAEDTIFDVVGCLEFEPGAQHPKKHREYLNKMAK